MRESRSTCFSITAWRGTGSTTQTCPPGCSLKKSTSFRGRPSLPERLAQVAPLIIREDWHGAYSPRRISTREGRLTRDRRAHGDELLGGRGMHGDGFVEIALGRARLQG